MHVHLMPIEWQADSEGELLKVEENCAVEELRVPGSEFQSSDLEYVYVSFFVFASVEVLRHQVSDLEAWAWDVTRMPPCPRTRQELCKLPSVSSSDRRLYEQEVSVLKHQQAGIQLTYSILFCVSSQLAVCSMFG